MTERLLRVTAPHFCAGAVFTHDGQWQCTKAAPILGWMVGKPPSETREYLKRKGWGFEWVKGQEVGL